MSFPETAIPPAVVDKCFIQYSSDSPPSLYGVPVGPADRSSDSSICLAPGLLATAVATISAAFLRSSSPLIDSNDFNKDALPVTVICSPHLNSPVAVDAAVRHIAHHIKADVVILDPADLAAGCRGLFGAELTDAFWQLYNYHYQESNHSRKCLKAKKDVDSDSTNSSDADNKHGLCIAGDDPLFASGNPETVKIEDSSFTRAKALVRKFLLMRSNADTDAENSLTRRRILYLRDYGTLCKAMLPLLYTLYDAASSGSPTLIIAGISPIQRVVLPGDSRHQSDRKGTQYKRFLDRLDSDDFMAYLRQRYCAIWRKPSPDSVGRYESLEDIFTAMFINRYQGKGIGSRGGDSSLHRGQ
ncbi:hypothetical protein K438DRAFT_1993195 [Mycena galopus ATCC 62051]|nr:hypothetical protein K438DRAFT_1993195 [Mycena galopus ATCC 62051]